MQPNAQQLDVNSPFLNIDHPLIILFQILLAGGLFRLYFNIRKLPTPVPLLIGIFPWTVILNAYARIGQEHWFWITDILMWGWFLIVVAGVVWHTNKLADDERTQRLLTGVLPPFDVVENWQNRLLWGFASLCAGLFVYYSITLWQQKETAEKQIVVTEYKTTAKVTARYSAEQRTFQKERHQIMHKQDTIDKKIDSTLTLVASNVQSSKAIKAEQAKLARAKTKELRAAKATAANVDTTKREVRGLKTNETHNPYELYPNYTPAPAPGQSSDDKQQERPSFWQRITKPFRGRTSHLTTPSNPQYDSGDSIRTARSSSEDSTRYVTY
ncbi:MAG: hypothetical protein JWP57_715 [Spirosoma sp.]|nr:hypothetical protein [Spirosoma sp.]